MNFKNRTRVTGVLFVLVALSLLYGDSFIGLFNPIYVIPTFDYVLPRLIDFLFYGGLILATLSVISSQEKTGTPSPKIKLGKKENSSMTVDEIQQKYGRGDSVKSTTATAAAE
ncbi:MAG: hypothetical protein OEY99_07010 [Aigarchaeota archaeon]|nr:hypothetical protein [Aigarchaeota archaeon]